MRIAQIAPLAEAVPPKLYGGTERVIWWLTEELVRQGHDVTLYASGDSETSARLIPCAPQGLRLAGIDNHVASTVAMIDRVLQDADQYDVIHFHIDFVHFPLFKHMANRCFTTLHGRLDLPDFKPGFDAFPQMPLVSISDHQRGPLPEANFVKTIYHGLPEELIAPGRGDGGYLAFLGRMSPEKRPDRAIAIAKQAGVPIKLAAKVDNADRAYFEEQIAPLLDHPLVEFIGEINDGQKSKFLGEARALIFPIDWPEPFGLVMIEAMAAGTPTVAWRCGSTAEVMNDCRSGALVDNIDDAVAAVHATAHWDRASVRRCFEEHFTARRMALDYVALFEQAVGRDTTREVPFLLAS